MLNVLSIFIRLSIISTVHILNDRLWGKSAYLFSFVLGSDRWTYIIPRGDGTVICGGTVDRVNRQTSPDDEITKSILERVYNLYPEITHGKGVDAFDIVAVNVGFRPGRAGGIRLEKEIRRKDQNNFLCVCV